MGNKGRFPFFSPQAWGRVMQSRNHKGKGMGSELFPSLSPFLLRRSRQGQLCDFESNRNILKLITRKRHSCQRKLVRMYLVKPVGTGG
jgi:hypothetical protein